MLIDQCGLGRQQLYHLALASGLRSAAEVDDGRFGRGRAVRLEPVEGVAQPHLEMFLLDDLDLLLLQFAVDDGWWEHVLRPGGGPLFGGGNGRVGR